MDVTDIPEVPAVAPLPSPQERRRREIMLARTMLVAIDIVLSGEPLGLETPRDLGRELRHAYPELVDDLHRMASSLPSVLEEKGRSGRGCLKFKSGSRDRRLDARNAARLLKAQKLC
jgi:hypothetical protein